MKSLIHSKGPVWQEIIKMYSNTMKSNFQNMPREALTSKILGTVLVLRKTDT